MDATLATVTVISLLLAWTMAIVAWQRVRAERRRADARIAALMAELAGAPVSGDGPVDAPERLRSIPAPAVAGRRPPRRWRASDDPRLPVTAPDPPPRDRAEALHPTATGEGPAWQDPMWAPPEPARPRSRAAGRRAFAARGIGAPPGGAVHAAGGEPAPRALRRALSGSRPTPGATAPTTPAWQPVAKVPAAFERRFIPPDCVVRRLQMPNRRPPHALSGGRLAALGATRGFTTACWGHRLAAIAVGTVLVAGVSLADRVPLHRDGTSAGPLELLSLDHRRQGDYLAVSGSLRNPPGGRERTKLSITATVFDRTGAIIGTGQTPLPVAALPPGGETAFTIALPDAHLINRYRVSFMEDQSRLPHVDRRGPDAGATAAGPDRDGPPPVAAPDSRL